MIVVSDTSILINLAWINQLALLPDLYGTVCVPEAVWQEIVVKGRGKVGADVLQNADWLVVKKVQNQTLVQALRQTIDQGEAEAIALTIEQEAELLLMDERLGRLVATQFNLAVTGLIGILLVGKKRGQILHIQPLLDQLRHEAGFYISDAPYRYTLTLAQEE